ncbi:hypothetical protein [Castellaniella sp.]
MRPLNERYSGHGGGAVPCTCILASGAAPVPGLIALQQRVQSRRRSRTY